MKKEILSQIKWVDIPVKQHNEDILDMLDMLDIPQEPCKELIEEPIYSSLLKSHIEYMNELLNHRAKKKEKNN